ncbi:MAG: SsrA-binding protein SmpB [Patescibacteria group bacterium]
MKQVAPKFFAQNRKAGYDYEILEKFEGGLVLTGAETKSVRTGGAKLDGAHLAVTRGELWLLSSHIRPYSKAGRSDGYDPERSRKVLVHAREVEYLAGKTLEKGLTLVPFSLYPAARRIKLSFALCRGRKAHDKREKIKSRDLDRQLHRVMRGEDVE